VHWQLQDAKQRFSEVVRSAEADGPQIVTRHGEEVAVVIDIKEYRRLKGAQMDFKEFILSAPFFDDLEIIRDDTPTPPVDFEDDE
jgi:prevent-host-death family protein